MLNKLVTVFLLCSGLGLCALPNNTTTWELRTLGAAANGGCFVTGASGTDFSQQNAAQFSGTDLVAVTTTTVSSVTHSFVATDVGNCIHVTAGTGFTPGFYNILSVSVGVATLGAAVGTMGSTGGTWAEGGAVTSPITVAANITQGNTIWVKADGTYTVTASIIFSVDNSGFNPCRIMGYTTARGDNGQATWTTATNSVDLIQPSNAGNIRDYDFYNLILSSTAGTPGDGYHTPLRQTYNLLFSNCVFTGFKIALEGNANITDSFYTLALANVEIKSSTGLGIDTTLAVYCYGCYIHNNGGGGVLFRASNGGSWQSMFIYSIIALNTGQGIEQVDNTGGNNGRGFAIASSAVYKNTGDGIKIGSTSGGMPFQSVNVAYYGNGGWGINNTGGTSQSPFSFAFFSNAFGANTSGAFTGLISPSTGTVTLSANPFTSDTNFALNSTAGGGTLLKAAGFPGVLVAGGTGLIDIGPLQSSGGGGGGGGTSTAGFAQ
jgi:hypothetical protein